MLGRAVASSTARRRRCGDGPPGRRAPWVVDRADPAADHGGVVRVLPFLLAAVVLASGPADPARASGPEEICRAAGSLLASGRAGGETLTHPEALRRLYAGPGCRPLWTRVGSALPAVETLTSFAREAAREGLDPATYHPRAIDEARRALAAAGGGRTEAAAALELLLSDAFLLYAAHLTRGRVDPASLEPEWNIEGRDRDLAVLMRTALDGGHLRSTLEGLPPSSHGYRSLRAGLARLRETAAAGGWPRVPRGPTLRAGDRGLRVAALRQRFISTCIDPEAPGAPAVPETYGEEFDAILGAAVTAFQLRHGLEPDGVVGPRTLAALNVPVEERVAQVEANLERLRWLPRDLGRRHVLVNVPDFRLTLVEAGEPPFEMRVIAGRVARRTPFFTAEITRVVLNPPWTVPDTIAVEDKLPEILADPGYLAANGYRVLGRAGGLWREVEAASVDWASLGRGRFPVRLRQDPGPLNALGRVKFEMPNPYDIYLHDTPRRELFERTSRSFSSGCIRLERPVELAERLLRGSGGWDRARLAAAIDQGKTVTIPVPDPIPVFLLYRTAWADDLEALQFREDVYGRDRRLLPALARPLP